MELSMTDSRKKLSWSVISVIESVIPQQAVKQRPGHADDGMTDFFRKPHKGDMSGGHSAAALHCRRRGTVLPLQQHSSPAAAAMQCQAGGKALPPRRQNSAAENPSL
jgi:hypothetical protein